MREADFPTFAALLDDVAELLPPPQPLGATARAMFFRALAEHDIAAVRGALDAHVKDAQRGRWFPKPADLIAQLEARAGDDGRPGAEEAWSIALAGRDEADTIVWTAEMAQAWGVVQPVLLAGDRIGARMAFKEAYARIVDEARQARRPVQWVAALGHDSTRHLDALRRAANLGLEVDADLVADLAALPAPRGALLLGNSDGGASAPSDEQRRVLAAVRSALDAATQAPSAAEVDRERTAWLKAQSAAQVDGYGEPA